MMYDFVRAQAQVNELCRLYRLYQTAETPEERQRISDSMFFDDPIVWILYKEQAYRGTDHALVNWGDLIGHSRGEDGICARRLKFLQAAISTHAGADVYEAATLPPGTLLTDVARHSYLQTVCEVESVLAEWRLHEYYTTPSGVAKWSRYQLT
jgi:hypothetical protein